MESNSREQRPYQFFKIVLPSKARGENLKIPPKFVKIFRDELPASATLTTPMGHIWPVRLEKGSDNSCFISDGWKEFAEHHSIGYGYFLVFGYEGVSNFRVSVFDLTACEIRYPCNPSNVPQNPYHGKHSSVNPKEEEEEEDEEEEEEEDEEEEEEEMQDDVSVEILDSSPSWEAPTCLEDGIFDSCVDQKVHRKGSKPLKIKKHRKFKHGVFKGSKKKHKFEDHLDPTKVDHLNGSSSSGKAKRKYKNDNQTGSEDPLIEHRKEQKTNSRFGRSKNRDRIIDSTRMLNHGNPSFTAIIKQYNNRLLYVPAEFGKKYLKKRSIKLQDSTGRQWPLTCLTNKHKNVRLSRGWYEFIKAKHLKEGDVCVFELVQGEDPVLKVIIFRQ